MIEDSSECVTSPQRAFCFVLFNCSSWGCRDSSVGKTLGSQVLGPEELYPRNPCKQPGKETEPMSSHANLVGELQAGPGEHTGSWALGSTCHLCERAHSLRSCSHAHRGNYLLNIWLLPLRSVLFFTAACFSVTCDLFCIWSLNNVERNLKGKSFFSLGSNWVGFFFFFF